MKVERSETLLIVADDCTPELITHALLNAGYRLAGETLLMHMKPRSMHGEEPPAPVSAAMKTADVILAPTTKSLTHTRARREASKAGARIATMPGVTEEMFLHGGMLADYQQIQKRAEALLSQLEGTAELRITTPLGTDITLDVATYPWRADTGICHNRGEYTNLPAGEVFVAPGDANGVFVVDASMGGIGKLEEPLRITVENRRAVAIEGRNAEQLTQLLNPFGPKAYNIAEVGIGLNPESKVIGVVLEDEKVAGTVHIALGNSISFGGDVDVELHLDGVLTNYTLYVDGNPLSLKNIK
jgi:leucyl aminopeptidase (aminopeptidase T)